MSQASASSEVASVRRTEPSHGRGDLDAAAGILLGSGISLIIWQLLILLAIWALR